MRHAFSLPSNLHVDWVTLGLILACYGLWLSSLFLFQPWASPVSFALLTFTLVLHASLTHEVIHGHPLPSRRLSAMLVWVSPGLMVPYLRFHDTHLAHHQDANLTDPYEDPETNYFAPVEWRRWPWFLKTIMQFNNTLVGRMLIGPIIGQAIFMARDLHAIWQGERRAVLGWLLHIPGVVLVCWIVGKSETSLGTYLLACYAAMSVLKIRTFLEHQAHAHVAGRTVIIEDKGPLAFLFLNNNLHVVHHMHPDVAWHRLPGLYAANPSRYLERNHGYRYGSYREIFQKHLFRAKDPVPHPHWKPPTD